MSMKEVSQEQAGAFPDLKHDAAAITSPGALLRERRLALHLNEWDIAREMRLQTQYILDLEADNFDAFSSLAFVRGYLRGYAKLVGIAEMEVIQLFNQLALQEKVATGIPKYITQDKSHGDRYWRWMSIAVVAFIGISLVLWWQNYNSNLKSLSSSVNTSLSQVSTLQRALAAEKEAATASTVAAAPDQVSGALGASADLLPSATTPSATPATTPVATSIATSTADATALPAATTQPAPAVKPKKKPSQSETTAHAPIVDGQAPRFGSD
jgi:cytoskeleton protein RodZ